VQSLVAGGAAKPEVREHDKVGGDAGEH
jgi:hypothetical protein